MIFTYNQKDIYKRKSTGLHIVPIMSEPKEPELPKDQPTNEQKDQPSPAPQEQEKVSSERRPSEILREKAKLVKPLSEETKEQLKKELQEEFGVPLDPNVSESSSTGSIVDLKLEPEKRQPRGLRSIQDDLPRNVRDAFEPMPRELEEVCANVNYIVKSYFQKPANSFEYGMLVVKVMETVEMNKTLSSDDKKLVALRCITELLQEEGSLPGDSKFSLIQAIPGSIEAIIQLTSGEPLNRKVSGAGMVEAAYITKRAVDRLVSFIRTKNYALDEVLENTFLLTTQIMYVVGGFPALPGAQKKAIVIDVFKKIFMEFRDPNTGEGIPETSLNAALDTLPALIDTFTQAASGQFDINTAVVGCFALMACCQAFAGKKKSKK
jgi:hypothetical protein